MKIATLFMFMFMFMFMAGCSYGDVNENSHKLQYKKYYQQFGELSKIWDVADDFLAKENKNELEAMPPDLKIVVPKCLNKLIAKWQDKNKKNIVVLCSKDTTGSSWDVLVETNKIGVVSWSITD